MGCYFCENALEAFLYIVDKECYHTTKLLRHEWKSDLKSFCNVSPQHLNHALFIAHRWCLDIMIKMLSERNENLRANERSCRPVFLPHFICSKPVSTKWTILLDEDMSFAILVSICFSSATILLCQLLLKCSVASRLRTLQHSHTVPCSSSSQTPGVQQYVACYIITCTLT
jgi:hypothetical protein